jgi:hypothetical protein
LPGRQVADGITAPAARHQLPVSRHPTCVGVPK